MAIDRRAFLAGIGAAALPLGRHAVADTQAPAFIAASRDQQGYASVLLSASGEWLHHLRLPGRGHGVAINQARGLGVIFARRPGAFAAVIGLKTGRPAGGFAPPVDRRFNGHGCFSADGRLLYAAGNAFDDGAGAIGVYDATQAWARVIEIPSYGIGPHEIIMLRGKNSLAVANGGIETHPDLPRQKLNIPTMRPNLSIIDATTGALIEQATAPAAHRLTSIRHLAEAASGDIWFGGQHEGPIDAAAPLIGVFQPGQGLRYLASSTTIDLRGYIGSVVVNRTGDRVAVTSPRGGVFQVWDAKLRSLHTTRRIADVSGVAADHQGGFVVSGGGGRLHRNDRPLAVHKGFAWDNHLSRI